MHLSVLKRAGQAMKARSASPTRKSPASNCGGDDKCSASAVLGYIPFDHVLRSGSKIAVDMGASFAKL